MSDVKRFNFGARDADGSTPMYVRASDYDALKAELDEARRAANDRAVELSMLGFGWMEAHDRCAAGQKNYPLPSPADVPKCIAERDALRAALERYGKHDGDCLYDDSTYNDGPWPCTCGFSEALRGTGSAADQPPVVLTAEEQRRIDCKHEHTADTLSGWHTCLDCGKYPVRAAVQTTAGPTK
jgi:hypothetical protein